MPFYEAMMIYNRYAKWIEDQEKENKVNAEQYEAMREQYKADYKPPQVPDYTKSFKAPDFNALSKGFMNSMPKFQIVRALILSRLFFFDTTSKKINT